MAAIKKIIAREILDSRGVPTIEGKLILDNDRAVTAVASSGESRGKFEGQELRDGDEERYGGKGVTKAVSYINDLIGPKLAGVPVEKQIDIDYWLQHADTTENFAVLGVNTASVISQLVLKANALNTGLPIYKYVNEVFCKSFNTSIPIARVPSGMFCMINGGKHGSKNLEFQEFQIIPSTANKFSKSLEIAVKVYSSLKQILDYRNAGISVSDEGGFAPNLLTNVDSLELIKETLIQKRIKLGVDIFIGLDLAASDFFIDGKYAIKDKPQPLKPTEYLEYLKELTKNYSILILEDSIDQEDHENWTKLNETIGDQAYIVADDFVAGNKERLEHSIKDRSISGVLLKMNQVGTISQMMETIHLAKQANLKLIISHRLGESNDSLIADLAVGVQADFVKFGAPVRGERIAKYNRLLEIENAIFSN